VSGVEAIPLGKVVKPTRPRVKPSDYPGLPFIGMEHVEAHSMKLLGTVPASKMKSSAIYFKPGDVLYGRLRPYLNKVYRPSFEGLCSAEFIVLPENERVDGRYLQYFLNSSALVRFASQLNAGDRPRIDFDQLAPYEIRLPNLEEQRRIVAEIEKQFSRLDEAVNNLKRARQNIATMRSALLDVAALGRLPLQSERDDLPGKEIASRVLAARRRKWAGAKKYKEPAATDPELSLSVPRHWATLSWEAILLPEDGAFKRGPFGSSLTKAMFVNQGYKVYEQYCPINDDCSFARYYIDTAKFEEMKDFAVRAGDFLVSCSGVTLGRITRVPKNFEPGIINQALLRVRVDPEVLEPDFFQIVFRSPTFQGFLFERSAGAAIPNLRGVAQLKAIPVPVPPISTQRQVIAEVERHLSIVRQIEAEVEANLARAQVLRTALLERAFSAGDCRASQAAGHSASRAVTAQGVLSDAP